MKLKDDIKGKIDFENLFPQVEDSSTLLLLCAPEDYSASLICRAVEDCDAHVLNLNVAGRRSDEGDMMTYLRVNRRDGEAVARSLERFGYEAVVIESSDESGDYHRARERANELLRYLEI